MQLHRRAALLSFSLLFLLGLLPPLRAASWGPPRPMDWDAFYALYEAAGAAADPADRVVTLTGEVRLADGTYELGPTLSPVTVETPDRTGFVVSGTGTLTVDNPGLTVYAEENGMAAFTVSGGYLDLRTCTITGRNAPAILMLADGTHLSTGGGGPVSIDVTYDGEPQEGVTRAGLIIGGYAAPFLLHNLNLTVRGGDAAISTGSSLALYGCAVRAVSDPPVPAISFESRDCTLTADADTVVDPGPPEAPPESGAVESVVADGTGRGWCLSGTERGGLPALLPETGTVWCVEDYRYEEGVPLVWDLGALPEPLTAGAYVLRCVPEAGALEALGIKNPADIAGEYLLSVWDPVPPAAMTVKSNPLPDGGAGRRATYKNLPPLISSGAEAVYIEYSSDGARWDRARVRVNPLYEDEPVYSENLLESPYVDGETMEFTVDVPAAGFYTRMVVAGGPFAGVSNTVDHGVAAPPELEDDGSGGDHGGGGQGVHDRPGKEMPEPGPSLVAPESTPAPDAAPEPSPEPSPAPSADAEAAPEAEPVPPPAAPGAAGRAMAAKLAETPEEAPVPAVLSTPAPAPTPAPSIPPPAQAVPAPEASAPQAVVTPVGEPTASVPGYAAAAGATAAALLAAAAWFHWRGKRK